MPDHPFPDLPILGELGAALDAAMARELEADLATAPPHAPSPAPSRLARLRRRFAGPSRTVVIAVLFAGLGTSTAAATLTVLRGSPIPTPEPADVQPLMTPARDTGEVLGVRSPDPGGGAPFALRRSRSETGLTCATVGQMQDDRFGVVGDDGVFRDMPAAVIDGCGQPTATGPAVMGARVFDADDRAAVRTVVYGLADDRLEQVDVVVRGRSQRVPVKDGTFLLALREYPEDLGLDVKLTFSGGTVVDHPLGAGLSVFVDPAGPAWRLDVSSVSGWSGICLTARASRISRTTPSVGGVCGASERAQAELGGFADDVLFAALEVKPGDQDLDGPMPWSWRAAPARTMVIGRADKQRVRTVEVLGAGDPIRPKRTGDGAFVVPLLPEHAPADLTIRLTFDDGTTRDFPGDVAVNTVTPRKQESR